MATKTVTGKLTRPSGGVVKGATVTARISGSAIIASTQEIAPLEETTTTGDDGTWSLTLQANLDLLPNDTYYTFKVGSLFERTAIVPQTAGPFKLEDIAATIPPTNIPLNGHVASLLVDGAVTFSAGPISLPAASIADAALSSKVVLTDTAQTLSGVKSFSAKSNYGTGDLIPYLSETNAPAQLDIRVGTVGSPDVSPNTPVKVSRTFAGTAASGSFSGQPVGQVAALTGSVSVVNPGDVQGFGVFGLGHTSSTQVAGANGKADATGVAGVAIAEDPTIHLASGGFFSGIMVTTAGAAEGVTGIQVAAQNKTGLGDHTVNPTGFSKSVAVYISAGNSFDLNGAAIEIANTGIGGHGANAGRFDVGLHVPAQVANSLTGAIATAVVQDDGTSTYSYLDNGTHSAASFASLKGPVLIGEITRQVATALLEINSAIAADPLVEVRTANAVAITNRVVRGPAGSVKFGYVGATGNFLTGTAAGDTVCVPTTPFHIGGTTKVITVTAANALGFFAKAPVTQPAGAGQAAAAGTASTQTTPWGYSTQAQADAIVTLVNQMRSDLVNLGLIKGSA